MPSPPPTPKTSHEVETILVQLQLRVQTSKDTNSKKKTVAKGKLKTKNKELAFTFELTEANYLSFLLALLKEHGFGKYTPVKKQHGFGLKVGIGAKCDGLCSVTFFPKNNQRMALTESLMMADSPLFSATSTTGHPCRTYIGAPSEYFLYSNTTNKTCILIIVTTNQHHVLSTAAQPEPHHAPHTFHVPGQSHCACTSSRGHELRSPQGLARFYVGILQHHPEYKSPHYMFIQLPHALHNNSLYVYVLLLYKYSTLLYVFR